MSIYRQQKQAYKQLENLLQKAGKEGIDKAGLIYQMTMNFEISEKSLFKRIDTMKNLKIVEEAGGVLFWKKKEEA